MVCYVREYVNKIFLVYQCMLLAWHYCRIFEILFKLNLKIVLVCKCLLLMLQYWRIFEIFSKLILWYALWVMCRLQFTCYLINCKLIVVFLLCSSWSIHRLYTDKVAVFMPPGSFFVNWIWVYVYLSVFHMLNWVTMSWR